MSHRLKQTVILDLPVPASSTWSEPIVWPAMFLISAPADITPPRASASADAPTMTNSRAERDGLPKWHLSSGDLGAAHFPAAEGNDPAICETEPLP